MKDMARPMTLPHPVSTAETLAANLRALLAVQPDLHTRLHWPVVGEHLAQDTDGEWKYQIHETKIDALPTPQQRAASLANISPEFAGTLWLFGIGMGQLLADLLAHAPRAQVIAWDRDPWVLRQALAHQDFAAPLNSGRLRFALNADLALLLQAGPPDQLVPHPIFARIYNNERELLTADLERPRALVCCGTLFVESLADALRAEGYSVFSFDAERQSTEELELVLQTWRPKFIAGINYTQGLAEFGEAHGVPYLCWEIDPATDAPAPLQRPSPSAQVFTYRAANIPAFRKAGLANVHYLPLAADPDRRKPATLTPEERRRYGAEVSFVGASMIRNVEPFQEQFQTQLDAWGQVPPEFGPRIIAEVAAAQRADFTRYLIPDLLDELVPGFRAHCQAQHLPDPAILLAETSAAEKRLNYLVELADHDLAVWGDPGWSHLTPHGIRTPGSALHETELPLIYSATTINIDIGRLYQSDIITMRIFDILACGGFVLAEHSDALADAFEVGVEVDSYRTLPELQSKVAHYLRHPEEAQAIAARGRCAVLEQHTIRGRVQSLLAQVR